MDILYLTSHVYDEDFALASKSVSSMPNPAGQNFHGKLIRALSLVEITHVYSILPQQLSLLGPKDFSVNEGLHYSYIRAPKNKYVRALLFPSSIAKFIAKKHKGSKAIILFDPLSATISKAAKILSARLNIPRIPILTDDIDHITGVSPAYASTIKSLVEGSNGSIALTEGLVKRYGLKNMPSLVCPVYVEHAEATKMSHPKPYIYYGGALFEKDGTKDLIDAFNELKPDYDLILSGHGQYEKQVESAAKENPRIIYLGQISKQEHYRYIAGAALVINPRHYDPDLDATAVPSKVMEYLSYGDCVASTRSTPLLELFGDSINLIEGPLLDYLKYHLDEQGRLKGLYPNHAKETIINEYGLSKSGWRLQSFLQKFH